MAVHAEQDVLGLLSRHSLEKPSDSLKVAVTAAQVLEIADLAVHYIEIYLFGADQCAGRRSYMTHSGRVGLVIDYLVIVSESMNAGAQGGPQAGPQGPQGGNYGPQNGPDNQGPDEQ